MTQAQLFAGTLVLPERLLPEGVVVALGERIAWVGPASELPGEWRDCPAARAEFVAPGLIDLHIHGSAGFDVMSGEAAALTGLASYLAGTGTTAFLATTLSAPAGELARVAVAVATVRAAATASPVRGAELLGLHLEGPYLNPEKAGAHDRRYLRPLSLAELVSLQELSGGAVRLVTLAPELTSPEKLSRVQTLGIRLAAGHSLATFDQAQQAFVSGVSQVTHLFNAMPPLGHRAPGLAGAALVTDGVCAQLILDGVHVHPAAARIAMRAKGPDGIALITDALAPTGLPTGRHPWDGRMVEVKAEGIFLVDGTLSGSTLTLLAAVKNAVDLGFSLPEAWRMGSLVPARALGSEGRKGSLTIGCDADLVLLDGSLSLTGVVCLGQRQAIP